MTGKKFVVILNKVYELSRMASALGHVTIGLSRGIADADASLVTYRDLNGREYPSISDWPFMILRASSEQMKTARERLREVNLPAVCYLDTMFEGGSAAQQAATLQKSSADIQLIALATFGPIESVDSVCKKYSLWH